MKTILASILAISCILAAPPPPARGAEASEALTAALASPDRPEGDRERDAGRKPAEVIAFLGIEPGMTVIDLVAAGGYYTEVLSGAVGPTGKVYAQNSAFILKMRDGANDKAMTARLAGNRLPNVERLDREMRELGLARESLDAAFTALNFHDIHNGSGRKGALRFLAAVRPALKLGGILGLIDHSGGAGGDDTELHRIDQALVEKLAKSVGFEVEARSELLRNPEDDRTKNVFDPTIRGKTDRFLLLLRRTS